jgi:uncharacterized protein YeeX (DUF496 family)
MKLLDLHLKLQGLTNDMTCAELRRLIDRIKCDKAQQCNDYEMFVVYEICDVTHRLAEKPIKSAYTDAIDEATTRTINWTKHKKKIKQHARVFKQLFNRDEITQWARQHLLALRTQQKNNTRQTNDPWCCTVCGCVDEESHPVHTVMLMIGVQAGPLCPKCLRRIPKTWYYKQGR